MTEGQEAKVRDPVPCEHDYRRSPHSGGFCIIIYECVKCGGEYERDVS